MTRLMSPIITTLFCGPFFAGLAQQNATAQVAVRIKPPQSAPAVAGRHITLDVVVTGHSGKAVSGLAQHDFKVFDDKVPLGVVSFRETAGADAAVRALIVVDAVNNPKQQVEYEQQQLAEFLRQSAGELSMPVSVVLITDLEQEQIPFTRDRNALLQAVNDQESGHRVHVKTQGIYGAEERADSSLHTFEKLIAAQTPVPARTLLIWLGRGWPYLEGADVELTSSSTDAMFKHIVWLASELRKDRTTVYSVDSLGPHEGLGDDFYYEQFLKGVTSASTVQPGDGALQVIAVQTGGLVLNRSNSIADSISTCLADASQYYTLAFEAPLAAHADDYHSLQIKIDEPKLAVRTRTGYYDQP